MTQPPYYRVVLPTDKGFSAFARACANALALSGHTLIRRGRDGWTAVHEATGREHKAATLRDVRRYADREAARCTRA